MTSLWLDHYDPPVAGFPEPGSRYEVVVVGAGITGLVTALLLARGGAEVAIIESRFPGAVTTGNTTGKLSLLQGARLSSIARTHSARTLRDYAGLNHEGQQWLLRYCTDNSIPFQHAPAITYAQTARGMAVVEKEYLASRKAGLNTELVHQLDTPFPSLGGVRLNGQAQLDPMPLLDRLLADALRHGAQLFTGSRVRGLHGHAGNDHILATEHGDVHAGTVILATGTPILDRGGFFARLSPHRSYAAAFRTAQPVPREMYLSVDQPSRSLRYAPSAQGELLLVGGNGHPVGRTGSARAAQNDLTDWARQYFPDAEPTHQWSAQDYSPVGEVPFAGPLLPGEDHILVAAGYAKWGLTNAVAAGLALTARVFGKRMSGSQILESWRPRELAGLPGAAKVNGEVAIELVKGWAKTAFRPGREPPAEGCGTVRRHGRHPVAVSTVHGVTQMVSAVCPHLGGILAWNDAEQSWDCPLHGSRFSAGGAVLEGPATRPLEVQQPAAATSG